MCLRVTNPSVLLEAVEDIVCYKVICKYIHKNGYHTPYRLFPITIGDTYKSKLELIEREYKYGNSVEKGLHSFCNLDDVLTIDSAEIIVKCIIPKGSKYYKGYFDGDASYASDTLYYEEILN